MCGCSFSISSDSFLNLWIYGQNSTDSWRTTRHDDGQSPRNKASKIQKLVFRCFLLTSAKVKKFQDGDRLTKLYTVVFQDIFQKSTHVCKKNKMLFRFRYSHWSKMHTFLILSSNRQTDRRTDCYNPPPTLGLNIHIYNCK